MKKEIGYTKYNKFILYLVVIVLINIAGMTLFFRIDLTANQVYSLSRASREVVSTLTEPLTVKVFFTSNLPAPYNNVEQYLHDLLQEYALAGNRYFNYQFYNVSTDENERAQMNQELARNYGIRPVQIQNIEQDEVKFQTAHMGMVLIHGDLIETIPTITSTEGLEFRITTTIKKMNNKISMLLGLKENIEAKLFLSSSLQIVGPYMNLTGLPELPSKIEEIVEKLNEKNYGRLSFSHFDPSRSEAHEEAAKAFNVRALQWKEFQDRNGETIPGNMGYAGIVLQHGGKTERISLIQSVRLPIFGTQYMLAELDDLEQSLNETLENLIDINEEIGYLADHGALAMGTPPPLPGQPQIESLSSLHQLLSAEYTVRQINMKEEGIPDGLPSMIIAGAKENFSDYELFQIDQFLMKGRNLAIFMDAFNEVMPQQQMMSQTQGPIYMPLNTGLEKLLNHYGLNVKQSYMLDENSYKQELPRQFGGGERPIYFAPIIKNEYINKDVAFLENIKGLVLLKSSPVDVNEERVKENGLKVVRLFSSTTKAWEMSDRIDLNPMFIQPPKDEEAYEQMNMAYTLEGEFPSYFADKPIPVKEKEADNPSEDTADAAEAVEGLDMSNIESEEAAIRKGKPGKIFLIGTSEILKDNFIDEGGNTPNAQFIMNVVDYLNNREDYAVMRSKSQQFNPLRDVSPGVKTFIKTANIAGLPVLVILAGLIVWVRRASRMRMIEQMFRK